MELPKENQKYEEEYDEKYWRPHDTQGLGMEILNEDTIKECVFKTKMLLKEKEIVEL